MNICLEDIVSSIDKPHLIEQLDSHELKPSLVFHDNNDNNREIKIFSEQACFVCEKCSFEIVFSIREKSSIYWFTDHSGFIKRS